MDDSQAYEILRNLSSPIVALTCRKGAKTNGMIANSAVRASIVPGGQRVALYVFKRHLTHGILAETGRFVLHLLSREQWDEVWALGFQSGRDAEKLEGLVHRESEETGLPILTRSYAWMECRVANVMDAGASTFFMGDVVRIDRGTGREIMDSEFFRENMPEDWREAYRENLEAVQEWAAANEPALDDRPWRGLQERARQARETRDRG